MKIVHTKHLKAQAGTGRYRMGVIIANTGFSGFHPVFLRSDCPMSYSKLLWKVQKKPKGQCHGSVGTLIPAGHTIAGYLGK